MSSYVDNEAAWIIQEKANPLVVGPGPKHAPGPHDVVIRNAYSAINPSEWKFQEWAYMPVQYPYILGADVAGEIVEVGPKITHFKVGQRVCGCVV